MGMEVDFACNDERGMFTGKAEAIEVADLRLVCTLIGGGVKIENMAGQMLKVGRLRVSYSRYRYGVGNWCWDGYLIAEEDILKIIGYLQRQKYWTCEEGPELQYEKFNNKQQFTEADLRNAA